MDIRLSAVSWYTVYGCGISDHIHLLFYFERLESTEFKLPNFNLVLMGNWPTSVNFSAFVNLLSIFTYNYS